MRQKIVNFDNERKEMMKWLEYGLSKSKNNKIVIKPLGAKKIWGKIFLPLKTNKLIARTI